jgi:hypothetical protein
MIFQESMVIPSLYTREDQVVIERWIKDTQAYPKKVDLSDSNKVAEISLSSVQGRLPQGLSIKEDGSAVMGRKTWDYPIRMRNDLIYPIHLFEVNLDDSHPGMTWPEAYYATFLPGYSVYAVTISKDSGDLHGYFDLAIGCFQADEVAQVAAKASLVIKEWWQSQQQEVGKQGWKELLKPGLIDAESAFRVRDEVWNKVENPDGVIP